MNDNRTTNELQYEIGIYNNLASVTIGVCDGAKISIETDSRTDSYGFMPISTDSYRLPLPLAKGQIYFKHELHESNELLFA